MGLALASTFSGFVSFTLLVRAFGPERFLGLLERKKALLWLAALLIGTAAMWGIHLLLLEWLKVVAESLGKAESRKHKAESIKLKAKSEEPEGVSGKMGRTSFPWNRRAAPPPRGSSDTVTV